MAVLGSAALLCHRGSHTAGSGVAPRGDPKPSDRAGAANGKGQAPEAREGERRERRPEGRQTAGGEGHEGDERRPESRHQAGKRRSTPHPHQHATATAQ